MHNEALYDNRPLDRIEARLDGTVYIGVAGSDLEIGRARDTIQNIIKRPGDFGPIFHRFTKGVEARQAHYEAFKASGHDFLLFLDHDHDFDPYTLERLRTHGLPVVSGLAFRRTYRPTVLPAWYEDDPEFRWPMVPFRTTPEPGRMYRLGATGFFCILIHRSVFEAVEKLLHGESMVLEDDMDVWPYELADLIAAQRLLADAIKRKNWTQATRAQARLDTLKPLRGTKDRVGADIRLSYFIRRAGYALWGDPAVHCPHYVQYPIGIDDWTGFGDAYRDDFAKTTGERIEELRELQEQQTREAVGG